ncbi:GH18 family chitinase [Oxalobacteraceae bacterium GrIS 2.11]
MSRTNKPLRKKIYLLAQSALITSLLVGCGGSSNSDSSTNPSHTQKKAVNPAALNATTSTEPFYDFGLNGSQYSGSFSINIGNINVTSPINTIVFTSNAELTTSLWYGSLMNYPIPDITKTGNQATGFTYTLDYTNKVGHDSFYPSSGTITVPWTLGFTGDPLNPVVPLIKSLSVNGVPYPLNPQNYPDCGACADPGNGKVIAGYQEQWSVYGLAYYPTDIPFTKLNTINYAFINFATPHSYPGYGSGTYGIVSADDAADYYQLIELYKAKQRYPYLKVVLSFGGWTNDNQSVFPDINFEKMDESQRAIFAENAAKLVNQLGLDGIDIDWEWWANTRTSSPTVCSDTYYVKPAGYCPQPNQPPIYHPHSTANYVDLLMKLRAQLGTDKLLSIATVSDASKIAADEDPAQGGYAGAWAQIASYVDRINVMEYDMHGAFDYHVSNGNLDGLSYSQATWDVDPVLAAVNQNVSIKASIQKYVDYGVPVNKLIIGFPAYGRSSYIGTAGNTAGAEQIITSATAPVGELDGGSNTPGSPPVAGLFSYKCLLDSSRCINGAAIVNGLTKIQKSNVTFYDSTYQLTPWGYGTYPGSTNLIYISYDDENSVADKLAKTCQTFGAIGGAMVWALDGDTSDQHSLVNSIQNKLAAGCQ